MSIDRIWSGWRSAYVVGEGADSRAAFDRGADAPSVFTQLLESGLSDDETHIVHRGPTCFAVMNAFSANSAGGAKVRVSLRTLVMLFDMGEYVSAVNRWQ